MLDISDEEVLIKLAELREDDLSKSILVPLFQIIYGCRAEFVGGREEKGRDIIIYRNDPIDGVHPYAVQVKKIKPTSNSQSNSFQQLITQLHQASSEEIICPESHVKLQTKRLIFVTPFNLGQRVMDSHYGALKKAKLEGVSIIDGAKLLSLLHSNAPDLLRSLMRDNEILKSYINPELTNDSLMKAINLGDKKNVFDIYCEVDFSFFLGAGIESPNFNFVNEGKYITKSYNLERLRDVIDRIEKTKETTGFMLVSDGVLQKFLNITKGVDERKSEISQLDVAIREDRMQLAEDLSSLSGNYYKKFRANGIVDFIKYFEGEFDSFSSLNSKLYDSSLSKCYNLRIKKTRYDELLKLMDEASYTLEFDLEEVTRALNSAFKSMRNFNFKSEDLDDYFTLIDNANSTLFWYGELSKSINIVDVEKVQCIKPPITLSKVFNSNRNIIILGDAGSGKTTSLQFFAKSLYEEKQGGVVVFCTLHKICSFGEADKERSLAKLISRYLISLGIRKGELELEEVLKNQKVTLILDSIDEACVTFPWVIDSLIVLGKHVTNGQVITSSRKSIEDVKELGFMSLTLCPFDERQKELFFSKWFNSSNMAKEVVRHLKENPKLSEVVTNPLSATILATLKENNIPLPSTESSLYQKRFDLLSGLFDRFKGVNRSKFRPELLIESAQYLAFEFHINNQRKMLKADAVVTLSESSINFGCDSPKEIVLELISPCEILLPEDKGMLSFGHLRFQEYLSSIELDKRKSLPLHRMLKNKWWHDVIYLYSQTSRDISWLIDDAISNNYTYDVRDLFERIIELRKGKEKETLNQRVVSAVEVEMDERGISQKYDDFDYLYDE
ncbi:NACHT domain-containing protein [Pseudoalteromonas sp. McH1-42]|uniref:NACHT domain-containing protein n=1 Tax=Pseudoalteromonas sp. McH1-42 TaxID=2917752 RepID=UPI001EF4D936|nr:NACHT domain-containing protein [Pseudoalteromonas sp. McH1-42]MCG7560188.1 NACHT domain-containing protein [Pseudoalteromonas sp. McH1-42]